MKEHPNALGQETLRRLFWIKRKNNVILVSAKIRSRELIRNSLGVITIAGTAGIEARLEDKPVLLFSDIYYQEYLEHIYKNTDFNEIAKILKLFNDKSIDFSCTNFGVFLEFMNNNSSNCYIYDPVVDKSVLKNDNIKNFLEEVIRYEVKILNEED